MVTFFSFSFSPVRSQTVTNVSRGTSYHRHFAVLTLGATFTNAASNSAMITTMPTLPFSVLLSSIYSSIPSSPVMPASCTRASKSASLYLSPRAQAIISITQSMAASCEERANDLRALVRRGQINVHDPVELPELAHRWVECDSLLDGVDHQGDSVLHNGVTLVPSAPPKFPAASFPTSLTFPM